MDMVPLDQVDEDLQNDGHVKKDNPSPRVRGTGSQGGRPGRATTGSGHTATRGIILTLLGGTLWGVNGTLSKVLMGTYGVDPLWLACVRELFACWLFLMAGYLTSPGRLRGVLRDGRSLLSILGIAVGSILFSQVAYLEAINWTNSATATILQSLSVVFVMVYVCVVNRRRPRRRELLGLVLALVGTYLVATGGDPSKLSLPPLGLAWGLGCAAAATILAIQPVRMIARWGNFAVNGLAFLCAGIILSAVYQPWNHMPTLDGFGVLLLCLCVVLGTFGAYALYLQGVKEVGSMHGSMLGTSEPVVAMISSAVWLGTVFTPMDLLGFLMIIVMVFLTA
ncbi:MAG: DMT family transporter [Atopobiaceae bacterium]